MVLYSEAPLFRVLLSDKAENDLSKFLETFLIINIGGVFVFVIGSAIGLLWFRAMRDPLEKSTVLFIIKIFLGIWAAMDVLYFIVR